MAVILIAGILPDFAPLSSTHTIHTLSNHSKLWATIMALRPSIIIIDDDMKTYNGRKLCRDIKQNKLTQQVAVILVTADANFIGYADAVIRRPVEPISFHAIIQQVLDQKAAH